MTEPFTVDAGARYAFAPSPDLSEGTLHRIYIVFQGSDGRCWKAGTELMAATRESAEDICGQLSVPLGLNFEEWTAFTERVFAANPYRKSRSANEPIAAPK